MMEQSKHNIFSNIRNSDNYYIVNLLSRNADILDADTAGRYRRGALTETEREEFVEKGYIVSPEKEAADFRRAYLDFMEARDNSEIQLFFVPTYGCNFNCSYCYQEEYTAPGTPATREIAEAFFSYIDAEFAGRDKYITIFGGEPLLPSKRQKEFLTYFIGLAADRELGLAVVTNGYLLDEYLDILQSGTIREIQVTLDGTRAIHDTRRPLHNGGPTFDRIISGIDQALHRELPVNLRVVVDRENIGNLPELASFAVDRGWTKNPLFKTQLGRNYELHVCQRDRGKLFDRLEMYREIYSLLEKYPVLGEFHRPAFSISRFLFDTGELPEPLFDSCPGCKTEWAFDYAGGIYSCTATVGKEGERLGSFYPEVSIDEEKVTEWEDRDICSIPECEDCNLRLACGGGCAAVAKNRTGSVLTADCRPVEGLISLGTSAYFEKQLLK